MKAMAISEIGSCGAWQSDHSSFYSKRSANPHRHFSVSISSSQDEQYLSKPSRVSRSLFGPSDRSESRRLECEEFSSQRFSDRSRWNFDFYQEKPIAGRYDWRKVCGAPITKDADKHLSGPQATDPFWSRSKSPKKYNFTGDESCMDLKRGGSNSNATNSWTTLKDNSNFRSMSRSPESKKKY